MNEAGIHLLLRVTARTTFVVFFFAFTGNALRDLWPGVLSSWLARKRDWFLVAMAVSHSVHLAAIIMLEQAIGWPRFYDHFRVAGIGLGGLVFVFIYVLALRALLRLRRSEEARPHIPSKLEGVYLYAVWFVFAAGFVPRMASGWPVYWLFGAAILAALIIRIACRMRHRRAMASAA